jgi:hypothetical protein
MLSQALLDRLAQASTRMLGSLMESVTYVAKSGPTASAVTHRNVPGHFEQYRENQIDQELILREDRRLRIATSAVTWVPSQYDEVSRADGSRWRVLNVSGGPGSPWYLLQTRRVA